VNAGGVEVGAVFINTSETYTFSGGEIIADTLTKSGEGKLVLNGPNTYANGAAISNGTVLVNGLLNGRVTVYAGTLGGSGGKINGTVNVGTGGTLSPGASVGVLEVTENVYLSQGATLLLELDASSPTVAFDVLRLLGDATELFVDAGTLLVVGVSGGGDIFGTYQVVEGGTVSEELTYLAAGHSFVLGTNGVLTVTSIPEPGTYALFGAIGAVALAFVRRRKTRRQ
jgi:autotransporter-associated beta strand protein